MEPLSGFWGSLWSFLRFLPFFFGLLLLGIIKGALICPFACFIMAIGNSALILGLWPVHVVWTFYSILRTKKVGPVLKLGVFICLPAVLLSWLVVGIVGSIIAGAVYGFLAPVMATFDAVSGGKENEFMHCFVDGTWSTVRGACTVVRDLKDICFHSYFSVMDDFRLQDPPSGMPYEIRLSSIPGAIFVGVLGILVDFPMISLIALCKSPIMLFKGWKRLIQDLIGREGPFLDTACVPFAGFAILLWPLAVTGAVLASVLASILLGAYGAVVTYQESSVHMGLNYIVSSLSIFDEYVNDVLDMPEGSCFPRCKYRKRESVHGDALSRPTSFKKEKPEEKQPPVRSTSFKNSMQELNPFKLLDHLFKECKIRGEILITEGLIRCEDIEEIKTDKVGQGVIGIGLPAHVILLALLRSAKTDTDGLILSDGYEITSENRPKSTFFDWFFDPLVIIKDQIKAENFSEEEDNYLCQLVLLLGDPKRMEKCSIQKPALNTRKQAEMEAFARRLQGITKSISRYPTSKRRFDSLVKSLSEDLERKMGGSCRSAANGSQNGKVSNITRMISQKSFGRKTTAQHKGEDMQQTSSSADDEV